jgi:hypothetical protein
MSMPNPAWNQCPGGFELEAGLLRLAITDQTDRHCGWVWHASVGGIYGGDTIKQHGDYAKADEAKSACEQWVREFCRQAVAALDPPCAPEVRDTELAHG